MFDNLIMDSLVLSVSLQNILNIICSCLGCNLCECFDPSGLRHERRAEDGRDRTPGRSSARSGPAATGEESNFQHIKVNTTPSSPPSV